MNSFQVQEVLKRLKTFKVPVHPRIRLFYQLLKRGMSEYAHRTADSLYVPNVYNKESDNMRQNLSIRKYNKKNMFFFSKRKLCLYLINTELPEICCKSVPVPLVCFLSVTQQRKNFNITIDQLDLLFVRKFDIIILLVQTNGEKLKCILK